MRDCISTLTPDDEALYGRFLAEHARQDPFSYSNSWLYFCHAARYNPRKYYDRNCLITLTDQYTGNPNVQIIKPLGSEALSVLPVLCQAIKRQTGAPILLRKLTGAQADYLLKRGFRKPFWNMCNIGSLQDDVYPQPVSIIADLLRVEGKLYGKLRRRLNLAKQMSMRAVPFCDDLRDEAHGVLRRWRNSFVDRYRARGLIMPDEDAYYYDPYATIIDRFAARVDNRSSFSILLYVDNVAQGFSYFQRVSETCLAIYAALANTKIRGLSEYLIVSTLDLAQAEGYQFVNHGGAETLSLYRHNLSFNPVKTVREYCLIYD